MKRALRSELRLQEAKFTQQYQWSTEGLAASAKQDRANRNLGKVAMLKTTKAVTNPQ
jgi:hypothetical protein